MRAALLGPLTLAGILERSRRGILRVTPRFLAHAEGTAGRLRLLGQPDEPLAALAQALRTWDAWPHDADAGATYLEGLMGDQGQLGQLRPVFPPLHAFASAGA